MPEDRSVNPADHQPQRRSLKPSQVIVRLVILLALTTSLGILGLRFVTRVLESTPVRATSTDPEIAVRQERVIHGLTWGLSYEAGLERAEAENLPALLYFGSEHDPNCQQLETFGFTDPSVMPLLAQFVRVQLYHDQVSILSLTESQRQRLARSNTALQLNLSGETTTPCLMILTPTADFVTKRAGFTNVRELAAFLKRALTQAHQQARPNQGRK